MIFTSYIKIFIPPEPPMKIMLVYQFYIIFPLIIYYTQEISPYKCSFLCDWVWRAGGRPHNFPHNNFSSVYRIFTKLGHMIPLWKGKNPVYFEVITSKVMVTITINNFFDNGRFHTITLVVFIGSLTNLATWFPCGRGRTLFILGSLGQRPRSLLQ